MWGRQSVSPVGHWPTVWLLQGEPLTMVKFRRPTGTHAGARDMEPLGWRAVWKLVPASGTSVQVTFIWRLLFEMIFGFFLSRVVVWLWRALCFCCSAWFPQACSQWMAQILQSLYAKSDCLQHTPRCPENLLPQPLTAWPFLWECPKGNVVLCPTSGCWITVCGWGQEGIFFKSPPGDSDVHLPLIVLLYIF